MDRTNDSLGRASHRCRCRECGAEHVRLEIPLSRCCLQCFDWIPAGSRAKYCSPDCRRAARDAAAGDRPGRGEAPRANPVPRPAAPEAGPRPALSAAPSRRMD
jgi:hypothetical protein